MLVGGQEPHCYAEASVYNFLFQNQSFKNSPGHYKISSTHPQAVLVSIAAIPMQLKPPSNVCGFQKKDFQLPTMLWSPTCLLRSYDSCMPGIISLSSSPVIPPETLFDIIFLVSQGILTFASQLWSTSSLLWVSALFLRFVSIWHILYPTVFPGIFNSFLK